MAASASWHKIFEENNVLSHDFTKGPFYISATQIKLAVQDFTVTSEKEVRLLCKHDSRKDRPEVFIENDLFILPVKNGEYALVKGQGYIDIPAIESDPIEYESKLDFHLDTAVVGDSEMQHLDMAYASSIIRTFMNDPSLVLTIRGRKRTPGFSFKVNNHTVEVKGVQTEVDAGYEGRDKIVLIEAKSSKSKDTIIRQMYYPFRQWQMSSDKKIYSLFFERDIKNDTYNIWLFDFKDPDSYDSIYLVKSERFKLNHKFFDEKPQIDKE